MEHDTRYWKLHKFVPDGRARNDIVEVVKRHFLMLKATHLREAAKSTYPSIFITEYMNFARTCELFHPKLLSYIDMEQTFITVNFEITNQDDNPDKSLIRFEFFEILIRCANILYKKTGVCRTVASALEHLIQRHIMPHSGLDDWSGFRTEKIYTVEVNDVLFANLDNLRRVY